MHLSGTLTTVCRNLQELLVNDYELGPSLEGWTLHHANSISSDGNVIVGYGSNPDGRIEAWRVVLSELSTTLVGDYDMNGLLDSGDIDLLSLAIREGREELTFDLNSDGLVDQNDHRLWVEDVFGTLFGDADLDRNVDFADFLRLSESFGMPGGWAEGDFDGNSLVEFADFTSLSANYGAEVAAATVAAVPEPTSRLMFGFATLGLTWCSRRARVVAARA